MNTNQECKIFEDDSIQYILSVKNIHDMHFYSIKKKYNTKRQCMYN